MSCKALKTNHHAGKWAPLEMAAIRDSRADPARRERGAPSIAPLRKRSYPVAGARTAQSGRGLRRRQDGGRPGRRGQSGGWFPALAMFALFVGALLAVAGPGLVAMLADTDAGSVITVAQSGAQWGYRLLLSNLLFIPFMFFAQELALRIGLGARRGAVELALPPVSAAGPALLLLAVLAASCFGALVSELSGLAGAGQAVGAAGRRDHGARLLRSDGDGGHRLLSLSRAGGAVLRPVRDRLLGHGVARGAGGCSRSSPRRCARRRAATKNYSTLLAANLGTSVIPWALLYQQSATVHKGLGACPSPAGARVETLDRRRHLPERSPRLC